jgi:hypothetical protein
MIIILIFLSNKILPQWHLLMQLFGCWPTLEKQAVNLPDVCLWRTEDDDQR